MTRFHDIIGPNNGDTIAWHYRSKLRWHHSMTLLVQIKVTQFHDFGSNQGDTISWHYQSKPRWRRSITIPFQTKVTSFHDIIGPNYGDTIPWHNRSKLRWHHFMTLSVFVRWHLFMTLSVQTIVTPFDVSPRFYFAWIFSTSPLQPLSVLVIGLIISLMGSKYSMSLQVCFRGDQRWFDIGIFAHLAPYWSRKLKNMKNGWHL